MAPLPPVSTISPKVHPAPGNVIAPELFQHSLLEPSHPLTPNPHHSACTLNQCLSFNHDLVVLFGWHQIVISILGNGVISNILKILLEVNDKQGMCAVLLFHVFPLRIVDLLCNSIPMVAGCLPSCCDAVCIAQWNSSFPQLEQLFINNIISIRIKITSIRLALAAAIAIGTTAL
jgi:hypothetical protein